MSERELTIIEVEGPPPEGEIIPSDWFEIRIKRDQKFKEAKCQSKFLISSARRKATSILKQAEKYRRKVMCQFIAECKQLKHTSMQKREQKWVKRYIGRLLDEAEQERMLIQHAAKHIHDCMAKVLMAWYEKLSVDEELCIKLTRQVKKLAEEKTLTLQVHPELVPKMQIELGSKLHIVAFPYSSRSEARLISANYAIDISLERHLAGLLNWLRSAETASGEPDDND